ncbi:DUF2723 domain-containing protein [Candidatus Riflebacteria bacterium]
MCQKNHENKFSLVTIFPGIFVFFASIGLYLNTLARDITWSDSGDFITSAYTLGVPHPTGYPLYTILAKLFTFLPLQSIAWRVSFMTAFFSAMAILFLYLAFIEIRQCPFFAAASVLTLASGPGLWGTSISTEVYTLNLFFVSFYHWFLFKFILGKKPVEMAAKTPILSFILGLGFTHHGSILFLIPTHLLLCFFLLGRDIPQKWKILGRNFVAFLFPFCLYLYLPIASSFDPPMDWGNTETLANFKAHVSARQYRYRMFRSSYTKMWKKFNRDFIPTANFTLIGNFFILLGIAWSVYLAYTGFNLYFAPVLSFLLLLLSNCLYTMNYDIPDAAVYYLPAYASLAFFLFLGLEASFSGLKSTWEISLKEQKLQLNLLCYLLYFLPFLIPLYNVNKNYKRLDTSRWKEGINFVTETFKVLPPNSTILSRFDGRSFALLYYRYCYKTDSRVDFIFEPLLANSWYYPTLKKWLKHTKVPWEVAQSWPNINIQSVIEKIIALNYQKVPIYMAEFNALIFDQYHLQDSGFIEIPIFKIMKPRQPLNLKGKPAFLNIQKLCNSDYSHNPFIQGLSGPNYYPGLKGGLLPYKKSFFNILPPFKTSQKFSVFSSCILPAVRFQIPLVPKSSSYLLLAVAAGFCGNRALTLGEFTIQYAQGPHQLVPVKTFENVFEYYNKKEAFQLPPSLRVWEQGEAHITSLVIKLDSKRVPQKLYFKSKNSKGPGGRIAGIAIFGITQMLNQ